MKTTEEIEKQFIEIFLFLFWVSFLHSRKNYLKDGRGKKRTIGENIVFCSRFAYFLFNFDKKLIAFDEWKRFQSDWYFTQAKISSLLEKNSNLIHEIIDSYKDFILRMGVTDFSFEETLITNPKQQFEHMKNRSDFTQYLISNIYTLIDKDYITNWLYFLPSYILEGEKPFYNIFFDTINKMITHFVNWDLVLSWNLESNLLKDHH
jgi:hypothetical protein